MKLDAQQLDAWRRDGVVPLGRVLTEQQVAAAREHFDAMHAAGLSDNPSRDATKTSIRVLNIYAKDPWFMNLIASEPLLDAAESVLGPNIQYFQDNCFWKPPYEGMSTQWHQDNIWWHADPPHIVTIWIALDDTDASNGAVQYQAGSHQALIEPTFEVNDPKVGRYFLLGDDQVDMSRMVQFTVPAGHAVMHHCMTVHGAPPNASPRSRRGYTVHLMEAGLLNYDVKTHPILRGQMPTVTS